MKRLFLSLPLLIDSAIEDPVRSREERRWNGRRGAGAGAGRQRPQAVTLRPHVPAALIEPAEVLAASRAHVLAFHGMRLPMLGEVGRLAEKHFTHIAHEWFFARVRTLVHGCCMLENQSAQGL